MDHQKKIRFYFNNFLFPSFKDNMNFNINGIKLLFLKLKNYKTIEKKLNQSFGVENTCYLDVNIIETEKKTVEFIHKANFLFSFCRGNIINYSHYKIYNENDKVIETVSIDPISTPYTPLELIPREYIEDTQNFLSKAYQLYDELDDLYIIRKIAREYPTIRNSSNALDSRSLILTAIVEYILFRFSKNIGKLELIEKDIFNNSIEEIKKGVYNLFENKFGKKNKTKIQSIVQKLDGLNSRTIEWKFQSFVKKYKIPITSAEIQKFITFRNSLVHTLLFPEGENKIIAWKFLINLMDKIIMGIFSYEGFYYNFFTDKDEQYKLV